jgi:hypothetical protein
MWINQLFRKSCRIIGTVLILLRICSCDTASNYDIIVYGGTSGGVIAAAKMARLGHSVLLLSPAYHPGGMTSNGLGATDIGNKDAIGGMAHEFYRRIFNYYHTDSSGSQWLFEPHVAEKVFLDILREAKVPVIYGERLDLENGVAKSGTRITGILMESGNQYKAKLFIDATYEGDLMALAGVSYTTGREGNDVYNETLNGVQTSNAIYHQFIKPVDPYVVPGDPDSGLLHDVSNDGPGEEGSADHRIQAYCFRLCTTDSVENRRDWEKPETYDESRYELLFRNFEAGDHRIPWSKIMMPNRKTDCNNNFAVSTDYIGMNYDYPEGDYLAREEIYNLHEAYQKGLMWTLANHPRVPDHIREHFSTWGPALDEFTDNDNWPRELYIREARRMISDYVMTQHNCQGREIVKDVAGLAAYTMDSHNVQRYVDSSGFVRNEGDVQVGGFDPYPISYRSIVPAHDECTNLFVPFCLSASHIAFGSIRMEPVFMVLSETASIAASIALENHMDVQSVDYEELRQALLNAGQILEWK